MALLIGIDLSSDLKIKIEISEKAFHVKKLNFPSGGRPVTD